MLLYGRLTVNGIPQARNKLVDEIDFLDLVHKKLNIVHELLGRIVVKDVHVHHLTTASEECSSVVFVVDEIPDPCKDESPRVYRLDVTTGRL